MRLNPLSFNDFINDIGQYFYWRKSYVCPCVNQITKAPDIVCIYCKGKGVKWEQSGVIGIAGVPSSSVVKEFSRMGEWESGDMMLTIPSNTPLYGMGERDRVLMQNSSHPFSINLRSGYNDKVPWEVKNFDRIFWYVNGEEVIGETPNQQADGTIIFPFSTPPEGITYSVTGTRFAEFFVYKTFPVSRGHHFGAELPIRVQLRSIDLFGR